MIRQAARRAGFTLIEVMGVIVVMGLVLGFSTDFYIDLSRASNRASKHTHDVRHATAIIDRIARDFESTVLLVKPPNVDPLEHPWLFFAESRQSLAGADHIKFVTRNFQRRRSDEHESDLSVVAYTVRVSEEDDTLELYRWSASQLDESLDRSFPPEDDEGSFLLAEGLADFGLTFFGIAGESDSWDSTTLLQSGDLPDSVEISVAMAKPRPPGDEWEYSEDDPADLVYYRRRVRLPVRPIDLAAILDPEGVGANADGSDEDGEGGENGDGDDGNGGSGVLTLGDCMNLPAMTAAMQQAMPAFQGYVKSNLNQPWSEVSHIIPNDMRMYILSKPGCR